MDGSYEAGPAPFEARFNQLHGEYTQKLSGALSVYGLDAQTVSDLYKKDSEKWLNDPSSKRDKPTFKRLLAVPEESVKRITSFAGNSIDSDIKSYSSQLAGILPSSDRHVWANVQETVETYGPNDSYGYVDAALRGASSDTVRKAMKTALDGRVWANVQETVETYGPNDSYGYVDAALRGASSDTVRKAMKYLISQGESQQTDEQTTTGSFGYRSGNRGYHHDHRQRQQTGSREQHRTSAKPHAENEKPNPQESEKVTRAKTVIAQIVSSYPGYKWLNSEDPQNVVKVLNTIERLRTQAKAKGETISDREIYLRFRRAVDTKSQEHSLQTSFRILDALMGGSPNNNLPV
jgi:uncharacterized protein YktA (UPF0223 family)